MPDSCLLCPCSDIEWDQCRVDKNITPLSEYSRPEDCPLYEIREVDSVYEWENMRKATSEEEQSINDYIDSISVETGIKFDQFESLTK